MDHPREPKWLTRRTMRRWRVALESAALVALVAAAKLVVHALHGEFIELTPLYTSVVAGGIFVIGLLVAGTLADYKEAERMPAEIAAALENIREDGVAIKKLKPKFNLAALNASLRDVVASLRSDLADGGRSRTCMDAIDRLSVSFEQLERLDVPPNYVVRLRGEQGAVRKGVLRVYYIQRTAFLPSAHVLTQSVVALIISALLFMKIAPLGQAVVVQVFISYVFVYLLKLLRILDTPFRVREHSLDDVSLFLLNEFVDRLDGLEQA